MKTVITVQYFSGESAEYLAAAPEWSKWEQKTGYSITQAEEKIGIWDLLFLGYNAMKREAAGKPVKPFEVWCDTVESVGSEKPENPKATPSEA